MNNKKECGTCTRCCDGTISGDVKGHLMYTGKPCFFLEIGGTCTDYENRPLHPCKVYKCLWLEFEDVPDYIKPENANAIIDIDIYKGKKYLRLTRSNNDYPSDVLTYAINYAKYNNLPFIWNDNLGAINYLGDEKLCREIILNRYMGLNV